MTNDSSETDANWSVPETEVLTQARDLLVSDRRGVLATVIRVEGSAYRRPGAKMVLPEDGAGVGHITAGCLEDEVQGLASEVLAAGEPRVEHYDLMPEADDDVWGLGVGCNGRIDILLEPLDETYRPAVDAFAAGRDIGVLTVTDGEHAGARAYYDPQTETFDLGDGFDADLAERVREVAAELTALGKADAVTVELGGESVTVFVDGLTAPSKLAVVGTGHDVGPIAELGAQTDFRVSVVGFRGAAAKADRFPAASEVVSTSPARMTDEFDFDANTYVVVATHNFVDDRLAIEALLDTPVPYVGLMGPHERFEEMLDDFEDEGTTFTDAQLDRLYTPVGLDLGGGSPYQIALSIVSEVLAVKHDREPRHLRTREGTIHDRIELSTDGSG
ncbi:XdhC family protein [Salinigranum halophilum]|jgi:xanthine dehydrogenase accessory factor|uniref:XdhC family protein n=1 Tax=Salinigranum halophilum TaxID=2565931 RepID=UPI00115C5C64|nr:XdhC/CoxI family protein [Salinigranum halophilum]